MRSTLRSSSSRFVLLSSILIATAGCEADDTGTGGGGGSENGPPEPLPALSKAPLTTDERLVPTHAPATNPTASNPRNPEEVDAMLADGLGDFMVEAGEPVMPRTIDDSTPPPSGPNAKMLTRFVHFADTQLADDESPSRIVNADAPEVTSGAFRPQEGHECRIMNATVRTINRLNQDSPVDFVLLGGDNADNAQTNEIEWVLSILSGADSVECDSGVDDDPVPGANNDPKDPFVAAGLDMPWLWVTGNHDVLNQGNFPPLAREADYLSDYAATGTRDWSKPGGPVILGDVPPDDRRQPLDGKGVLALVKADGDGHGITDDALASGRAFYAFDVEGTPLRIITLDTTAPTGSSEGLIRQSELDDFIIPTLDDALAKGKYVILTSHHASARLTDGGQFGGVAQPDAVLPDAFQGVVSSYPNILMHLAGHTHHHKVTKVEIPMATPYWEVETAALADFPNQLRVIEIWDLDNGYLSIRMIGLDYQTENDPIAADGRARGIVDLTSGWTPDGTGELTDRNVELYVKKN